MHIINTLSPVFLLIGLGYCLRKTNFFDDDFVRHLTKLIYWVAMPSMLFYKAAVSTYDFEVAGKTFLIFLAGILIAAFAAWCASICLRLKPADSGTFIQSAVHGNIIFVGLAVILYDITNTNPPNSQYLQSLAVVVVSFAVIVNNLLAVTALKIPQHAFGFKSLLPISAGLMTNPIIISSLAGIAYSYCFGSFPKFLALTFSAAGQFALPTALIAIGATLTQTKIADNFGYAFVSAFIKIAVAPIAGFLFARAFGISISSSELKIALILLASPTAVAAYILTTRLKGNCQLSATVIVIGTVLSFAPLAAILALF